MLSHNVVQRLTLAFPFCNREIRSSPKERETKGNSSETKGETKRAQKGSQREAETKPTMQLFFELGISPANITPSFKLTRKHNELAKI